MFRKSINKQLFLFLGIIILLFYCLVILFSYFSFKNQIFTELAFLKNNPQENTSIFIGNALQTKLVFYTEKANELDYITLYYEEYKSFLIILISSSCVLFVLLILGIQNILQNAVKKINTTIDELPKKYLDNFDIERFPKEFEPLLIRMMKKEQQIFGMNTQNQKFRAFASHELRNELAILLSLIEQSENKDEKTVNHVYSLKATIDDLLLLSHFPDKFQFYEVDLLLIVATVVDKLSQETDIVLHYDEKKLDFNILGTENLIMRCIYNIVNNAILYKSANSVVDVYIENIENVLLVKVVNQAVNASFDKKTGHGIGLELVNHIVYVLQGYFYKEIKDDRVSVVLSIPQRNRESLS